MSKTMGYVMDLMEKAEEEARKAAFVHHLANGEYRGKDYAIDWVDDNWPYFTEEKYKSLFE